MLVCLTRNLKVASANLIIQFLRSSVHISSNILLHIFYEKSNKLKKKWAIMFEDTRLRNNYAYKSCKLLEYQKLCNTVYFMNGYVSTINL